jgi:hypothetical protein
MRDTCLIFDVRRNRFGFEISTIWFRSSRYMTRWILWFSYGLRVHKFWRGDDDRAPHDHPFDFWTFPLRSYTEKYWDPQAECFKLRIVERFRWHYRPAEFRHIVIGRKDRKYIWTIVFTCRFKRSWGFWPTPTTFVPAKEWIENDGRPYKGG